MNRRKFFKLLAGTAAIAALAPKLLVAPKKTWADIKFTTHDLMMSLDDFEARILEPAMREMAKRIDDMCLEEMAKGNSVSVIKYQGFDVSNDASPKTFTIRQPTLEIDFDRRKLFGGQRR